MEMVTSWMEEGIEKGLIQGRQEGRIEGRIRGRRHTILVLLAAKFGSVPESAVHRLDKLSSDDELDALSIRILTASSLEELGLAPS